MSFRFHGTELTPDNIDSFVAAYKEAKEDNKTEFEFDGRNILVPTARTKIEGFERRRERGDFSPDPEYDSLEEAYREQYEKNNQFVIKYKGTRYNPKEARRIIRAQKYIQQ